MSKKSILFLFALLIAMLLTGCRVFLDTLADEYGEELKGFSDETSNTPSTASTPQQNESNQQQGESSSGQSAERLPPGDMVFLSYFRDEDEIPSLAAVMHENYIDYTFMGATVTEGYMFINSILAFFGDYEPEYFSVQIYEETFTDVDDVWGAIDEIGRMYSEDYDFWVNFPPTDYPDYGPDYRYCEFIKQSEIEPAVLLFIASIYSKEDSTIIFQFGIMNQVMSDSHKSGIGPLNLEKIAETQTAPE